MEELQEIKKYLNKRIEETIKWEKDKFAGKIDNITLRSYSAEIEPIALLNDSTWVERYGVIFRLKWIGEETKESSVDISVRIATNTSKPYVSMCIFDQNEQEDDSNYRYVTKEYIAAYEIGPNNSIQDFYRHWLTVPCKDEESCASIFLYKKK